MTEPSADYLHADEVADGMRQRCIDMIRGRSQTVVGVVFSTADVLYLLAAYDELRGRHGDREADRGDARTAEVDAR